MLKTPALIQTVTLFSAMTNLPKSSLYLFPDTPAHADFYRCNVAHADSNTVFGYAKKV
jgi:hypothetical protein